MPQKRKKRKTRAKRENIPVISPLVTPAEAGKVLLCDPRTIINMIQEGRLRGEKIGGRYKVSRASLESFVHRIEGVSVSSSSPSERGSSPLAASAASSQE